MRYKPNLLTGFFALFLCWSTLARGQESDCLMQYDYLPCELLRYSYVQPGIQVAIPVAMHIVRYEDHTGGFDGDLDAIVDTLNMRFVDANMEFFLYSADIIESNFLRVSPITISKRISYRSNTT
jgi:hypothetical protein